MLVVSGKTLSTSTNYMHMLSIIKCRKRNPPGQEDTREVSAYVGFLGLSSSSNRQHDVAAAVMTMRTPSNIWGGAITIHGGPKRVGKSSATEKSSRYPDRQTTSNICRLVLSPLFVRTIDRSKTQSSGHSFIYPFFWFLACQNGRKLPPGNLLPRLFTYQPNKNLQDRLREHAEAFDGLLSLIPAKHYYGEDNSVSSQCLVSCIRY
jgi:hypothetical protein